MAAGWLTGLPISRIRLLGRMASAATAPPVQQGRIFDQTGSASSSFSVVGRSISSFDVTGRSDGTFSVPGDDGKEPF